MPINNAFILREIAAAAAVSGFCALVIAIASVAGDALRSAA